MPLFAKEIYHEKQSYVPIEMFTLKKAISKSSFGSRQIIGVTNFIAFFFDWITTVNIKNISGIQYEKSMACLNYTILF